MFEKFTDEARRTIVLAQDATSRLSHNYMGTEHLLMGLAMGDDAVAKPALDSFGLTEGVVHDAILEAVHEGTQPVRGHLPFTPRLKHVLELALRETIQLRDDYTTPAHLLLGLLRRGEDALGVTIIVGHGVSIDALRGELLRRMDKLDAVPGLKELMTRPDAPNRAPELAVLEQLIKEHGMDDHRTLIALSRVLRRLSDDARGAAHRAWK